MGLEPDARLVVNRELDLRALPLTPADFFLFSRVEALSTGRAPRVGEVIAASGQSPESAGASLEKLVAHGALKISDQPGSSDNSGSRASATGLPTGPDARERARNRRRELLEAQLRMARGGGKTPRPEPEPRPKPGASETGEPKLPGPGETQPSAASASASQAGPRSILDEVEPVVSDDPRLEPDAAVDLDRQRRLLGLRDHLRQVGHFELFGLDPVDDPKLIRRAYHLVSREFHPDSHYGKKLASFHEVLGVLFRRARASYEVLMDEERRRPLVEAHQAQLRAEQAREQAALDEARREAESERLAAAAEARDNAQDVRVKREHARHARLRERAVAQRREQAREHAERAYLERDTGRHGAAATLFRLAHEHDPDSAEYEQQWRESLAIARRMRAESSYDQARIARKEKRHHDAARLFADAAAAEPSLRNLAEAAAAMAEVDGGRARTLALAALEAIAAAQSSGDGLDDQTLAGVHMCCARAFMGAGQHASAREQAERAHHLAPSERTRTLLNSIKLT